MHSSRNAKYYLAAAVALMTLLVYLPALHNNFVEWDDGDYASENLHIRSLGAPFFKWAFSTFATSNWHPLTWISHAVDYAVWGLDPLGHHLTSIILHALNTFLVVALMIRLLDAYKTKQNPPLLNDRTILIAAGTTGLLFGLHPVHVESVAWVSERKDLLSALFFLLSIIAYTKFAGSKGSGAGVQGRSTLPNSHASWKDPFTSKHYLLTLGFFVLALLSKPMAVTLPAVLLILDWHPFGRISSLKTARRVLVEKLPFIALSLGSSTVTVMAQRAGGAIQSLEIAPLATRVLVAAESLIAYLWKMIWPFNLVPFYPYPANASFLSFEYLSAIVLVLGISASCIALAKKQRLWLAAWAYYVVTLIPVIGIIQVGAQAMADRYAYLPSLGPYLIMGLGAAWILKKVFFSPGRGFAVKLVSGAGAVLVLGVMSSLTVRQTGIWENSIVFWNYVIEKTPGGVYLAYNDRGLAFEKMGMYDNAMEDFGRAIALSPSNAELYSNRGDLFANAGRLDQAIADYDKAVSLNPLHVRAYNDQGLVLQKLGRHDRAVEDFSRVIALDPSNWETYYNRGLSNESLGRLDEAIADYEQTIVLNPLYYDAYYRRDWVLKARGR